MTQIIVVIIVLAALFLVFKVLRRKKGLTETQKKQLRSQWATKNFPE